MIGEQYENKIKKLALYEPPFIVDDSRPSVPEDYAAQLSETVAAGRLRDAVEIFMTRAIRMPVANSSR